MADTEPIRSYVKHRRAHRAAMVPRARIQAHLDFSLCPHTIVPAVLSLVAPTPIEHAAAADGDRAH